MKKTIIGITILILIGLLISSCSLEPAEPADPEKIIRDNFMELSKMNVLTVKEMEQLIESNSTNSNECRSIAGRYLSTWPDAINKYANVYNFYAWFHVVDRWDYIISFIRYWKYMNGQYYAYGEFVENRRGPFYPGAYWISALYKIPVESAYDVVAVETRGIDNGQSKLVRNYRKVKDIIK